MSVKVTLDMRQLEHDDWQQGSLLPVELVAQYGFDPEHLYVIITHSCDLLSNDLALEPFVTVLEGHRVASPEEQKALEKGEFVEEILMVCPPYEKNISAVIIHCRLEVSWLDCVRGGQ
jgi:hypothetical protein